MNQTYSKATALIAVSGLLLGLSFQNCSKMAISDLGTPSITDTAAATGAPQDAARVPASPITSAASIEIAASATTVIEGQESILTVRLHEIETATYQCTDRFTHAVTAHGNLLQSQQQIPIKVEHDLECQVTGFAKNSEEPITATQNLTLDCANRIKNSNDNKCQDFKCEKVVELASMNDLLKIEARDTRGLCYAIKLLSGIANSPSELTTQIDQDVTSRNHGEGLPNHHPFNMGSVKTEFRLEGKRVVKLSGGLSDSAPILVDNFILYGIHPSDKDVSSSILQVYSAMGTADSSILDGSGSGTGHIEFNNSLIPLKNFGRSGTSSVAAVDLTTSAQPKIIQTLDFRALDCGGSRELSDIYLLFQ